MNRVSHTTIASHQSARLLRAAAAAGALAFAMVSSPASLASAGTHASATRQQAPRTTGTTRMVMLHGYAFVPATLTVHVGDTIMWTNDDSAPHNIIATGGASFRSPLIRTGQSWSWTAATAGAVSYECSLHPGMDAHLTVLPAVARRAPVTHRAAAAAGGGGAPAPAAHPVATQPSAATSVPATSAPATAAPATSVPAAARTTLDPMLVVIAIAVATVVFCLLLVAGGARRPRAGSTPDTLPPGWVVLPHELEDVTGGRR